MDIATPADTRLNDLNFLMEHYDWSSPDDYTIVRWAHDEIVKLRAAADALRELHTILDFDEGWHSCHCLPNGRAMNLACEKAYAAIELLRATDRVSP